MWGLYALKGVRGELLEGLACRFYEGLLRGLWQGFIRGFTRGCGVYRCGKRVWVFWQVLAVRVWALMFM